MKTQSKKKKMLMSAKNISSNQRCHSILTSTDSKTREHYIKIRCRYKPIAAINQLLLLSLILRVRLDLPISLPLLGGILNANVYHSYLINEAITKASWFYL